MITSISSISAGALKLTIYGAVRVKLFRFLCKIKVTGYILYLLLF